MRTLLTALIILLGLGSALAQQPGETGFHDTPGLPEGIVGDRIAALVETLNANDPERLRRWLDEEATPEFAGFVPFEQHQRVWHSFYQQTGGVDVFGIRTYTPERPEETVVILRDRTFEGWRGLVLELDPADDHRVTSVRLTDARPPVGVEEPALAETELTESIEALVERLCARDAFSGAVLVARGEQVLYEQACGEASKRFHVANKLETKFNLGSMNKMFTSVAVAQLAERGLLAYDDPISRYVDETWLPKSITDRVTVHHLLTHTSGLGSYFNDAFMDGSRLRFREIDDFKPLVRDETLAFEPGAEFRYSNTGMLLLGVVIEEASGMDYFDYIREHIYEPAGMTHTDSYPMDEPVENLAIGYIPAPDRPTGWTNNIFEHVVKGGPAGGGFSTVGDLHRFALALFDGTLVSAETRDRLWTDHSGEGYGYGFILADGPAGKIVGHGGGFPGLNGNLDLFLDSGYVVAVLANYDNAATPLARRIRELIGRTGAEG